MNSSEGTEFVAATLNRLGVPFLIVGSFSSNIYTAPRSTLDADFVIETDDQIAALRDAIAPEFTMNPQVGFETKLMTTKYEFFQKSTDFKVEVFVLSDDPHDRLRFTRRFSRKRGGVELFFPHAEDVIVQKLRWGRKKDQLDVTAIIRARHDKLDWSFIRNWAEQHGTTELLELLKSEALPGSPEDD